ncbi:hypothetical protein VTN77DRAFT_694 [Rasamsonia byssochlamydoides]|uniref:uncharacterized protein n=1 Tax=Rasamsonia byssochlamydoides TaxID=89139 RepID=UPI00374390B6
MESESLESAVAGKIKLMLAELYMHLHRSCPYGDKLPHQETYLFGMHGSRLHIFRAWFPGPKCSAIWCRKEELPVRRKILPVPPPTTNDAAEIKTYDEAVKKAMDEYLSELGGEPDMRTFRVVASREFDLWKKGDFKEAVKTVVAIFSYFMSGRAQMGTLTEAFRPDSYYYDEVEAEAEERGEGEEGSGNDSDEEERRKQEHTRETVQRENGNGSENESYRRTAQPEATTILQAVPANTRHHHPYHPLQSNPAEFRNSGSTTTPNDDSINHYLESRWLADLFEEGENYHNHNGRDDDEEEEMMDGSGGGGSDDDDCISCLGLRLATSQWLLAHTRTLYRVLWG